MDLITLREYIQKRLSDELPAVYTYHALAHTLDVTQAALEIAQRERISEKDTKLIEAAALLHDSGYLIVAENHEEHSCSIASEILPQYHFNDEEIEAIHRMIRATKLPQSPADICSKVLCDADLDYLGRDDYFEIAHQLFLELKHFGKVNTDREWVPMQIHFLENHRYFTASSRELRQAGKENIISLLKKQHV